MRNEELKEAIKGIVDKDDIGKIELILEMIREFALNMDIKYASKILTEKGLKAIENENERSAGWHRYGERYNSFSLSDEGIVAVITGYRGTGNAKETTSINEKDLVKEAKEIDVKSLILAALSGCYTYRDSDGYMFAPEERKDAFDLLLETLKELEKNTPNKEVNSSINMKDIIRGLNKNNKILKEDIEEYKNNYDNNYKKEKDNLINDGNGHVQ